MMLKLIIEMCFVMECYNETLTICVAGTTWGCVGVANKVSTGGAEEGTTERQVVSGSTCATVERRKPGSQVCEGAGAVGDVRLAPASRLG